MKRRVLFIAFVALSAMAFSEKSKITIKNTIGADLDEFGDYDVFSHTRQTDIEGKTISENVFSFGDQFQLDFESKLVDARLRLEALYSTADDAESKFLFSPTGFVHFEPFDKKIGFIAGNSYGKRFAVQSAYFAASDDTTKWGRLLTDSLGHDKYFGSSSAAVLSNGFAFGATSALSFGEAGNGYMKAAAGATMYPDGSDTEAAVDFGFDVGLLDGFDFAFTSHAVNRDERKFGAFLGYTGNKNLVLNAHFYYNFTDSDYLPETRVERSGVDEFKKQSTKYALAFSGGYKTQSGFGFYADFLSGLTNEYIGKIKYYDADGNLSETKIKTIIRGGTIVKYKNGKPKRTDEFEHEAVPFFTGIRLSYDISKNVETELSIKIRGMFRDADSTYFTIYPKMQVSLPQKRGNINGGIRLDFNTARFHGLSSVSIPLSYTYKFKKKF